MVPMLDKMLLYVVPTFALLPLVLLLEYRRPARPGQRLLSVGLLHDAVWALTYPLLKLTLFAAFIAFLSDIVHDYLPFLIIDPLGRLSAAARALAVVLAADFLAWFHHWVRHKIPLLWEFHQVHHSQRELNHLSDLRVHPLDWAAAQVVQFIPFVCLSLGEAVPAYLAFEMLKIAHTRVCHANIRTNLGWLRFLLVTPQSHRLHHSMDPGHYDCNFGVIFSIWDRLLGTAHADTHSYPATGIPAKDFPHEQCASLSSLVLTPLRQIAYPLARIARRRMQTGAISEE